MDDVGIFASVLSAEEISAIPSLALEPSLGYDLGDAAALFTLHDNGSGAIDIDGLMWQFVAGGLASGLTPDGNGGFTLGLGLNGSGVQTVSAAVPEPASIVIWSLIGLGLVSFGYRRTRLKK